MKWDVFGKKTSVWVENFIDVYFALPATDILSTSLFLIKDSDASFLKNHHF